MAGTGQSTVIEQRLKVTEYLGRPIRDPVDLGDSVRPRRGELRSGDSAALVAEQVVGVSAEQGCDVHLGGSCLVVLWCPGAFGGPAIESPYVAVMGHAWPPGGFAGSLVTTGFPELAEPERNVGQERDRTRAATSANCWS